MVTERARSIRFLPRLALHRRILERSPFFANQHHRERPSTPNAARGYSAEYFAGLAGGLVSQGAKVCPGAGPLV
jgi:hypothetical protein